MIEVRTRQGFVYALYTHRHTEPPRYGALLRVFDHVYASRPSSFDDTVKLPIRFNLFFPLQAAVNRKLVEVVANVQVPEELQPFPVFRSGLVNPETKKVHAWWLWDGDKSWQVGELTDEQRKLSIRGTWNDTMLIQRIEDGWRPETDPSSQ